MLQGQAPSAAAASLAAITVRIRDVERGVDEGVLAAARSIAHLVPLAVALLCLSSRLAIAAILLLAPFALILAFARRFVRVHHARSARLAEGLHSAVDELVRHLDLWRTYGAARRVHTALGKAGDEAGRAAARAEATRGAISGANEVLAAAALLGLVVWIERSQPSLGNGSLVAFAAVFFMTYRPLRDLGDARTAIERGAASLEALEASVQVGGAEAALEAAEAASVQGARSRFRLAQLSVEGLRFDAGGVSGRPVRFTAEPGRIVAIVGPTGSGKTTLLRGLLGLVPATEGALRYDGEELTRAGVGPDERPFAWVPQEAAIVSGTIEENVGLGAKDAPAAEIRRALAEVGGLGLAEARGGARIVAGGHELSGGERQLVAIARAVASHQPVLLLDEPTSGLDAEAEARVLAALAAQRGTRTILIVTHRPGPLSIADEVISFEGAAAVSATTLAAQN
ncbi:ATP-binding cassette domain-containing protein [Polyangium jinanense]|uniref:ATP-binding cassette domain-containing protein n=1 Tax=Polyangium jinanense TaxID=2829994 RepID=UPI0023411440|nr:ATP-binding cassette domain-containing protein [Polyangium jinanense]MDC3953755.1 ATP-binding cassette domain-containing protein [Polyangium jinanense]